MTTADHSTEATPVELSDADMAVALAGDLLAAAALLEAGSGRAERARRRRMATLVDDAGAKAFTMALTDEVNRITDPSAAAKRLAVITRTRDLSSFSTVDRLLLRTGGALAPRLPRLVMPFVRRRLRRESSSVILPATDPGMARHLARRSADGFRSNINLLGEAILGNDEADARLAALIERLDRPDVDYVSVKISSICAGIKALAFDDTVSRVSERVRRLYRAAARHQPAKFVNLDMEEYRDLALTLAVFRSLLEDPEFRAFDAGIVLQAYLPDSHAAARDLCNWATQRYRNGGGRIKIRLVKGANLAMEHVEAELHGWTPATYATKAEVDASYKAILDILLEPIYDDAVVIGLASHNLFDVAWGLVQQQRLQRRGCANRLELEMLEGMAPAQAEVVRRRAGSLLLYTPVVSDADFTAAIAYLVRRLDENTSPDNFLSAVFDIAPGNDIFLHEEVRFRAAVAARHDVATEPRRGQDRPVFAPTTEHRSSFVNEPDTDFALPANRSWIENHLASWSTPAPIKLAGLAEVELAIATARAAQPRWASLTGAQRADILNAVADVVADQRGTTLTMMAHEAGKTISEGDPEVSEAVDFARYYATCAGDLDGDRSQPLGTVVVTPPWNFPYAIPLGGVVAALAAGNTVILKPAPQSPQTARLVAEHCWRAGVPTDVLQYLPCPDTEVGQRLVSHCDVDAVILTGAHATAEMFHAWRPELRLHAETSGKNSMIITASADLDNAIGDLVRSSFGHAGQKCSATSMAIVEASVHDNPSFQLRLADAVRTLRAGSAVDLSIDVGPLIEPPTGPLHRALTTLEPGESWLVEPRQIGDDERQWSPGVRIGVQPGSWFAQTECFGPVLGVIRVADLDEAISVQNGVAYGLTAGIHALDADVVSSWTDRVQAGNAYVNRTTTGAIVQRQPFGGWKQSVVGPTAKAGGPNYIASLRRWADDSDASIVEASAAFEAWMAGTGRVDHDPTGLVAERNVFRYRPLPGGVLARIGEGVDERAIALLQAAADAAGTRLVISRADDEPADELAERLAHLRVDRLRIVGDDSRVLRQSAHAAGVNVDDQPPTCHADGEMWRWLREQSVSTTMHRHGHVRRDGLLVQT